MSGIPRTAKFADSFTASFPRKRESKRLSKEAPAMETRRKSMDSRFRGNDGSWLRLAAALLLALSLAFPGHGAEGEITIYPREYWREEIGRASCRERV